MSPGSFKRHPHGPVRYRTSDVTIPFACLEGKGLCQPLFSVRQSKGHQRRQQRCGDRSFGLRSRYRSGIKLPQARLLWQLLSGRAAMLSDSCAGTLCLAAWQISGPHLHFDMRFSRTVLQLPTQAGAPVAWDRCACRWPASATRPNCIAIESRAPVESFAQKIPL